MQYQQAISIVLKFVISGKYSFWVYLFVCVQFSAFPFSVFSQDDISGLKLGPMTIPDGQESPVAVDVVPLVQQDAYQASKNQPRILEVEPRIIGGEPASIGDYPWQVSISRKDIAPKYSHFCGGSIISATQILTAAHCVDGKTKIGDLVIAYGTNNLSINLKTVGVKAILLHPNWNRITFDSDIAILETMEAIEPTIIQLVSKSDAETLVPEGVFGTVTGWGLTESGARISKILQHVGIKIVSNETCSDPKSYGDKITSRMICAGFSAGGKDSCQGDSGGPLIVLDNDTSYKQVGIVSWGEGCAKPEKYGVYTRVSEFESWVLGNMK
ncbi:MAG: serine protease [Gammaproteobacteria bacterium]|nr:serine protease [Gammaproteobacteria bacterium]